MPSGEYGMIAQMLSNAGSIDSAPKIMPRGEYGMIAQI
jgi:hypothetical protein